VVNRRVVCDHRRLGFHPCQPIVVQPALSVMQITAAAPSDLEQAVGCLATAFAEDPITGFLLQTATGYQERVTQFFSLLMRARIALSMPVLVARGAAGIHGAAMGYTTACPEWPRAVTEDWDQFEKAIPGLTDRIALYDEIAEKSKPSVPHYYLGVIGIDPTVHGLGIGTRLLKSFCDLSASDRLSSGVYLETANPSNVQFYERAGFAETGRGSLGNVTLWCMFLPHELRHDA
jgi:GNAT superfamily N-acetyltransferase